MALEKLSLKSYIVLVLCKINIFMFYLYLLQQNPQGYGL